MNLSTVIGEMATALGTINPLRVASYPDGQMNAPQITITIPDKIVFDGTYGRGSDQVTLMAVLCTPMSNPRTDFPALLAYCAGGGSKSVKTAIEAGTYTQDVSVRVTEADFDVYTLGATSYYAAVFSIDVYGMGA